MATLFSRCYMRPKAGGREKVVGVAVLLVVLGVVALYICQIVTSERAGPAVTANKLPHLPQTGWGLPVRVSVFTSKIANFSQ